MASFDFNDCDHNNIYRIPSQHTHHTSNIMSDDDSSGLSSLGSDIEDPTIVDKKGILKFFSKVSKNKNNVVKNGPPASPSPPPRELSPPHEYVLADNPDIAVC